MTDAQEKTMTQTRLQRNVYSTYRFSVEIDSISHRFQTRCIASSRVTIRITPIRVVVPSTRRWHIRSSNFFTPLTERQLFSSSETDPRLRKMAGVFISKSEPPVPVRFTGEKHR